MCEQNNTFESGNTNMNIKRIEMVIIYIGGQCYE